MAVPLTPSVVRRLSLVLVVIQASGVAAPTGAANATLTTTASKLYFIPYVPFMIFLPLPFCCLPIPPFSGFSSSSEEVIYNPSGTIRIGILYVAYVFKTLP
jgi:hypothetical protein